jgi:hypothetical protein
VLHNLYVHRIFPANSLPPPLLVTTDLYIVIGLEDTVHLHISNVSTGLSNGLGHQMDRNFGEFRCFYVFQEKIIYVFLAVNGNPTPSADVIGVYFVINFLLLIGQATAVTVLSRPIERYNSGHTNL